MTESTEGGSDRLTISMPRGFKAALEARVQAGEASSVSALITRAVEEKLARQRTDEWIMSRRGGQPIDPEAMAYWRTLWAAEAAGQIPA